MKRTLQFRSTEDGYACFDNKENIFEISKAELQGGGQYLIHPDKAEDVVPFFHA